MKENKNTNKYRNDIFNSTSNGMKKVFISIFIIATMFTPLFSIMAAGVTISLSNKTQTSVTVGVTGLESGVDINIYVKSNDNKKQYRAFQTVEREDNSGTLSGHLFTGLEAERDYVATVEAGTKNDPGATSQVALLSFSTPKGNTSDPTIRFELIEEKPPTNDSGLMAWDLNINTTNIPNNGTVSIQLFENGTRVQIVQEPSNYKSITIKGNVGNYFTTYILKPGTKYTVKGLSGTISDSFEKITAGEAPKPPTTTNDTDTFWFLNMDKDWMGTKGKLKLPGFATSAECEIARSLHWQGSSANGDNKSCFVATAAEVLAEFEIEKKKNATIPITGKQTGAGNKYDPVYHLLAPIPGLDKIETNDIGKYFDTMFLIAIGLCGVLAVIMFIIGAVQYMGEESIFGKTKGKEQMTSAILGLLIALGSYALLNTINPDLLGKNGLTIAPANITLIDKPDAGDNTVDPDFNKGNESYSTGGAVSSGITEAVSKLKNSSSISSFNVSTSSKTMTITMGDGFSTQSVPIDIGLGGVSEVGAGITGDNKTPKGNWKILEVRTSAGGKPVFSKKGSNMGASFWLLSPTTNGDRGIGMHGNKSGTLPSTTNGCIRLKNSDLLALLPYIKTGTSVVIK